MGIALGKYTYLGPNLRDSDIIYLIGHKSTSKITLGGSHVQSQLRSVTTLMVSFD